MTGLADARIVNTRALHQAGELDAALRAHGAVPVSFPCIAIVPPDDPAPLMAAWERFRAGAYDWLILTSVNAVAAVRVLSEATQALNRTRVAAIGSGTARALSCQLGIDPEVVPDDHRAASLAALSARVGDRVLLPSSSIARPELADALRARGVIVDVVVAYQTVIGSGGADLAPLIVAGAIDAAAFASPSAVDGFISRVKELSIDLAGVRSLPIGCIGPTTADRAAERGFASISIADRQTVDGLVDSIAAALSLGRKGAAA